MLSRCYAENLMLKRVGKEQRFTVGSGALEVVSEYTYLGQAVTTDPDHETEVIGRIRKGSAFGEVVREYPKIWNSESNVVVIDYWS